MRGAGQDLEKFSIKDGDLLVCEGGEPGRCAIWNGGHTEIIFQKALMRIRCKSVLLVKYLQYWLYWCATSGQLEQNFTGTTIKHLPKRVLENLELPIPSLTQQTERLKRIEATFSRIDRIAQEATRATHLLDRLDERLLCKAFQGEFVQQDPDDEPAEALLERIREARASAPNPKRARRKINA